MHPLARALHARTASPRLVDEYYAPLALACLPRIARARPRPAVLGIQGPQGSGKTTLAAAVVAALGDTGVRAASVSIDDFYLTHDEQRALAERHPGNPYLCYRGYPGTHDVALGLGVIRALCALGEGDVALVPAYDKSAHRGRGDRAPRQAWRRVTGPLDLVLVEGWMLGFSPVQEATLEEPLLPPNAYLAAYEAWTDTLDALVHLDVEALGTVVGWRVDAERARRLRAEDALSDEDARDYIERFLPAYRVYVPWLNAHPPCADFQRVLLGEDRLPVQAIASSGSVASP
jgi:D-glycerate 3-kinase